MKIKLLCFADKSMSPTLKRIRHEALDSGFFDDICAYDQKSFDKDYWKTNKDWFNKNKRGYGYWIWKSYLIRRELDLMADGDILIYLDSGCIINKAGEERFNDYISLLSKDNPIICFEHSNCYEYQYQKSDFLDFFGLLDNSKFLRSKQKLSAIILFLKCPKSIELINEWYEFSHNNKKLIDDSISKFPETEGFIEHRHDQSIFSYLCWKYEIKGLPQTEVEPIIYGRWETMTKYPFWAARKKEYKKPPLVLQKIINLQYRIKCFLKNNARCFLL